MPTSRSSCGCSGFSRSELLRTGTATAGSGLRAIEPGMPLPAGTGLSRRSFVARSAGLALAVFGARRDDPERARGGHRVRAGGGHRPRPDLDLLRRRAGLAVAARAGRRLALPRRCGPASGCRPTRPSRSPRTRGCSGTRTSAAFRDLHAAGKLTVIPAIGYDDANQSHFTSRHYWEVGELNPAGRIGWLGRYLDSPAPPTTRCRACRWTGRWRRRSPPRASRSPPSRSPTSTACTPATSGTTGCSRPASPAGARWAGSPTARRRAGRGAQGGRPERVAAHPAVGPAGPPGPVADRGPVPSRDFPDRLPRSPR